MKYFFLFLIINCSLLFTQPLNFFREDITFRLSEKVFKVEGLYWFENNSGHRLRTVIYYPFPAKLNFIDSVEVINLSNQKSVQIQKGESGISFLLEAGAGDTTLYKINYNQRITGDSAKYILCSTQLWNNPIKFAEYKLIPDNNIEIISSSYNADKIYDVNNIKVYYWKRTDFMPDRDIVVHFKKHSKD